MNPGIVIFSSRMFIRFFSVVSIHLLKFPICSFFFFYKLFFFFNLFFYLFIAVLGLRFCARAFSSCGKWWPLFIAVRGPLTIAASLVVEHRLQMRRLSNCDSRAQLLRGMWDIPGPGLEPVSPALAGGFLTTAPPGKPPICSFFWSVFSFESLSIVIIAALTLFYVGWNFWDADAETDLWYSDTCERKCQDAGLGRGAITSWCTPSTVSARLTRELWGNSCPWKESLIGQK